MRKLLPAISIALLLTACGGNESGTSSNNSAGNAAAAVPAAPKQMVPENPELAAIYKRSCISCHANGAANAPRTGNKEEWAPRMEKGMDAMLESAINGMGGMPALGLCMDCNEEQFEGLINFMAGN